MKKRLFLMCLLLPLVALAEGDNVTPKAYRWVGEDGSVHFSSSPPPPGVKATEIELRQPETVIHQENRSQILNQGKAVGDRVDARLELRQRILQQIDGAKSALEEAKKAQAEGEAPKPGELQHLANGSNRLSESYHQRRVAEAQRVGELQSQIDKLYQELEKLR